MIKFGTCVVALAAASFFSPALADDCKPLTSYGELPMTQSDGHATELVPVDIKGTKKLMVIDTAQWFSRITSEAVDELNLNAYTPQNFDNTLVTVNGTHRAAGAPLTIGKVRLPDAELMIDSTMGKSLDPRAAGSLAGNILKWYDVSIDFGAHTFALLSQDHCDGQVVYWPERPIASIPFDVENGNGIFLHVNIDGQDVTATIDPASDYSTLDKSAAERIFNIVPGSADTPADAPMGGQKHSTTWTHHFKSLSLGGLGVTNPEVHVVPDKESMATGTWSTGSKIDRPDHQGFKTAALHIGMNVLKHLHIYIAYKENKIYITPAGKPAGDAPATAAPAAASH